MNNDIKNELHKLVDDCENELLLAEIKALLTSGNKIKDWWDELTEEDKNLVMEYEAEYEKGDFISHSGLMKQFESWKNLRECGTQAGK
jgi:hypothetical protein